MISSHIVTALNTLKSYGYEAYLVGGCVRDMLLNRIPADYDIATSAKPEETIKCFPDFPVIETGIKHGTVTLVTDNGPLEITTYRIDGEYKDCRRPETVTFTPDLYEDLARRDFTINAMALEGENLVDPFCGKDDLRHKLLRCVGVPEKRFSEDALRIMRAIRFASVLDFEIEEKTSQAIHSCTELLKKVSVERIFIELKKLLSGPSAAKIINEYFDVLSVAVTGLMPTYHIKSLSLCDSDCMRLAIFLYNSDHKAILKKLKCDNATAKEVDILKSGVKKLPLGLKSDVKKFLSLYGEDMAKKIIVFGTLCDAINESEKKQAFALIKKIVISGECFSLKQLAIKGSELISLGIEQKSISCYLAILLDAVIEETVKNDKESLLLFVRQAFLE